MRSLRDIAAPRNWKLFLTLGVNAQLGRPLHPERASCKRAIIVISDGLWNRR